MPDNPFEPIPGVEDSDLEAATRKLPDVPSMIAPDPDRFTGGVRLIAENRAQSGWPQEGSADFAAFVLTPYPREVSVRFVTERIMDLTASDFPILGKIFFLNADASNGHCMPFPTSSAALVLDWLAENGMGRLTIVMVYRAKQILVARPTGVDSETRPATIRSTRPAATLTELLEALDLFHRQRLLTPTVCPSGVWESSRASQYIPGRSPEKSIQRELANALNFWFRGVIRAEMEDTTNIGRIDVRLLRSIEAGPLSYWAIIELKLIRSSHHAAGKKTAKRVTPSENAEAVSEGIHQAWAFTANRQAQESLLEIYDLRKDKSASILLETAVRRAMKKCSPIPTLHVRALYGSASDARVAGFTGV